MREQKATPAQIIKAKELAERYKFALENGSKQSQDQALRAYERFIEKIGTDPLI